MRSCDYFFFTLFPNNSLIQLQFLFLVHYVGTTDPSEIFQEYYADICEKIEIRPLPIVNRLYSAKLISLNIQENVRSMSGDAYDKADKVVKELQDQVKQKGMEFLEAICDFFMKNQELKDIGVNLKYQLESKTLYHTTCALYIRKLSMED